MGTECQSNDNAAPYRTIEWAVSDTPVAYPDAVAAMERRVAEIAGRRAHEMIWLLEHTPLYTAGTSAKSEDLLVANRFPVFQTGRGGQFTYHGPGQRVVYVMLDLSYRNGDVRAFVKMLEDWIITTVARFGVQAVVRPGRIGVWVPRRPSAAVSVAEHTNDQDCGLDDKIAAIGIRVRRSISFHGLSLNVSPQLDHFDGIVPCGIAEHGVTSLAALGAQVDMQMVDDGFRSTLVEVFGGHNIIDVLPPI